MASLFSRYGATVFGIGRDTGRLAEVFADVPHGSYASVDISSAPACRDAVERCVDEFGGPDVLVNIAGRHQMRRTESMTDDDWAQRRAARDDATVRRRERDRVPRRRRRGRRPRCRLPSRQR